MYFITTILFTINRQTILTTSILTFHLKPESPGALRHYGPVDILTSWDGSAKQI